MLKKEHILFQDKFAFPQIQDDPCASGYLKRQRVLYASAIPKSENRYDPETVKQAHAPDEFMQLLRDTAVRELFHLVYGEVLTDVREIRCLLNEQVIRPHFAKMAELQHRFDILEAKLQGKSADEIKADQDAQQRPFDIEDRVLPHVPFDFWNPEHSVKVNHPARIVELNSRPTNTTGEIYHGIVINGSGERYDIKEKYLVRIPVEIKPTIESTHEPELH